ncbi:uncharacterized protein DMAD_00078 [Drosophila madeirensis]|uniref:Uncharacterized protein n=1 Tax=Drosophila madeirensis TaxID=30013 RepID=A0AAU9FX33_DROMD
MYLAAPCPKPEDLPEFGQLPSELENSADSGLRLHNCQTSSWSLFLLISAGSVLFSSKYGVHRVIQFPFQSLLQGVHSLL